MEVAVHYNPSYLATLKYPLIENAAAAKSLNHVGLELCKLILTIRCFLCPHTERPQVQLSHNYLR